MPQGSRYVNRLDMSHMRHLHMAEESEYISLTAACASLYSSACVPLHSC